MFIILSYSSLENFALGLQADAVNPFLMLD